MVNIRIPGRRDGSRSPPAFVDVAVDKWVQRAIQGLTYIGIAALSLWLWQALDINIWLVLGLASIFTIAGAKYLSMAYKALPPRKRRLRRSRRDRRF